MRLMCAFDGRYKGCGLYGLMLLGFVLYIGNAWTEESAGLGYLKHLKTVSWWKKRIPFK